MNTPRPTILGFGRARGVSQLFTATQEDVHARLLETLRELGLNGKAEQVTQEILRQPDYASGVRYEVAGVRLYLSQYSDFIFQRLQQAQSGEMWRQSR